MKLRNPEKNKIAKFDTMTDAAIGPLRTGTLVAELGRGPDTEGGEHAS